MPGQPSRRCVQTRLAKTVKNGFDREKYLNNVRTRMVNWNIWQNHVIPPTTWNAAKAVASFFANSLGHDCWLDLILPTNEDGILIIQPVFTKFSLVESQKIRIAFKEIYALADQEQYYSRFFVGGRKQKGPPAEVEERVFMDHGRELLKFFRKLVSKYTDLNGTSSTREQFVDDCFSNVETYMQSLTNLAALRSCNKQDAIFLEIVGSSKRLARKKRERGKTNNWGNKKSRKTVAGRARKESNAVKSKMKIAKEIQKKQEMEQKRKDDLEKERASARERRRRVEQERCRQFKASLHPKDPSRVPQRDIERPLLMDALANRGATLLTDQETTQAVLVEVPYDDTTPTVSETAETYFHDVRNGITRVLCVMMVSYLGMYGFVNSRNVFHGEICTNRTMIQRGGKKVYESDLDRVLSDANEYGCQFLSIPPKGEHLEHSFIKVLHHDSEKFKSLNKDLHLDAPGIVDRILMLHGEKSIDESGKMARIDLDDLGVKRGAQAFHMGYGNQNFDSNTPAELVQSRATFPQMIHLWKNDNPSGIPGIYKWLYESIGELGDVMQDFVDRDCAPTDERDLPVRDRTYFNDPARTAIAGCTFRNITGGRRLRFEAATISVTCLGPRRKFKKKHMLKRHQDGPNDQRDGYDLTVIYYLVFELDGIVYRLAVIFYSRSSVGDAMFRDREWMEPAMDMLNDYEHELPFSNYNDITWDVLSDEKAMTYGTCTDEMLVRRTMSLANPDGYWSISIDTILKLIEDYSLDDGDYNNYRHILSLCYIAVIMNCQWVVAYVMRRWRVGGPSELKRDRKKKILCKNLLMEYKKECAKLGVDDPSLVGIGSDPRMGWSGVDVLRKFNHEEQLDALDRFEDAVQFVNYEAKTFDEVHRHLYSKKSNYNVPSMGEIMGLQFLPICLYVGLIHTHNARLISFDGTVGAGSAFKHALDNWDCKSPEQRRSVLKRLAKLRKEYRFITENVTCKACRYSIKYGRVGKKTLKRHSKTCYDTFTNDQLVFRRELEGNGASTTPTLYCKPINQPASDWEAHNPTVINPKGPSFRHNEL